MDDSKESVFDLYSEPVDTGAIGGARHRYRGGAAGQKWFKALVIAALIAVVIALAVYYYRRHRHQAILKKLMAAVTMRAPGQQRETIYPMAAGQPA